MDLGPIPVLDHHAHGLMRPALLPGAPYAGFFTEARDREQIAEHAPLAFSYRRNLREVAQLLGVDSTEAAVAARREALGVEAYARRFFDAARIEAVFLDDGFAPDQLEPVGWHDRFFPTRRILRLEAQAEGTLAQSRIRLGRSVRAQPPSAR